MRSVFAQDLETIFNELTQLGQAANVSLHKAIEAYFNDDKELAHELFSDDLRINAATADIEKLAYRIIALQQPVAKDLRLIFTVLHSSLDIERIADHAVSIGKATLRLDEHFTPVKEINDLISQMANIAESMLNDAIRAFKERDTRAARQIADRDREIDLLLKEVFKLTIGQMESSTELVTTGISYIGVGRNLERIGDYVTNICERIVFLIDGEIVELN